MQLGPLGFPELLLLFVVLLIVFGPRRLPEIGRQIGKAMAELRKGTREIQRALEEEVEPRDLDGKTLLGDVRREIEGVGEDVRKATAGAGLTYYDAAPPPYGSGPAPPAPGSLSAPTAPGPAPVPPAPGSVSAPTAPGPAQIPPTPKEELGEETGPQDSGPRDSGATPGTRSGEDAGGNP